MRVSTSLEWPQKRTHSPFLFRILRNGHQNLVNGSVDLLLLTCA
jgi:hypothetical protein